MSDLPPTRGLDRSGSKQFPSIVPLVFAILVLGGSSLTSLAQNALYNINPLGPTTADVVDFQYNDTCPDSLTQLKWTFGDGQSFTNNDPAMGCDTNHMYASKGVYHTKLTISPSGQSLSKDVGILGLSESTAMLTTDFSWIAGEPYRFQDMTQPTNSVGWWEWVIDGTYYYVKNPTKSLTPGDHSVSLSVQNQNSYSTITKTVHVPITPPPVADFSYTPTSPQAGDAVSFTDQSLYSPTSWSWNFGDPGSGASNTSSAENPTHSFSSDGVHTVSLTVSNAGGTSTKTRAVAVGGSTSTPVAAFSYSPATPLPGTLVAFTDASTGSPTAWSWDFGDPGSGAANTSSQQNPTHQFSASGSYTVTLVTSNGFGSSDPATQTIPVSKCQPDSHTLCLNDNRFRVQVTWSVPLPSNSGLGNAVRLTGDTGYFWFFQDTNIELVIKVLDARSVNHAFWVFYGALSNVQYTITVTDTETDDFRIYQNPYGHQASFADTLAFLQPATVADLIEPGGTGSPGNSKIESRSTTELHALSAALSAPTQRKLAVAGKGSAAPCTADTTTLCLNDSRFRVTVDWSAPAQGLSGQGHAIPVTNDTGYFWFFQDTNIELILKVLDGRGVNGHFWVFYGALSDVQYRITVTDTQTNDSRVYDNPSGNLASFADTSAF